jgi:hypothetical protein
MVIRRGIGCARRGICRTDRRQGADNENKRRLSHISLPKTSKQSNMKLDSAWLFPSLIWIKREKRLQGVIQQIRFCHELIYGTRKWGLDWDESPGGDDDGKV